MDKLSPVIQIAQLSVEYIVICWYYRSLEFGKQLARCFFSPLFIPPPHYIKANAEIVVMIGASVLQFIIHDSPVFWHISVVKMYYSYSLHQQSPWEANHFSGNQEIPYILWNPKVHSHMPTTCPYCIIHRSMNWSKEIMVQYLKRCSECVCW
jgi:hypothetical protein